MKKLIIILIMVLITLPLISQEINDNDREHWESLNSDEKWESFKQKHNSYIRLKKLNDYEKESKQRIMTGYEEMRTELNNVWYPKHGFQINLLAGIDYDTLTMLPGVDVYTSLIYKKYFLKGRGFIDLGLSVKIYDKLGGGLILGVGFLL